MYPRGWPRISLLCTWVFLGSLVSKVCSGVASSSDGSPFNQKLPDCSRSFFKIEKATHAKAILCPMIKDEIGFLSEWVAYYQMHGFDHIMVFDDGSSDDGLLELKPWITSGFVSVHSGWNHTSLNASPALLTVDHFRRTTAYKNLLESDCKQTALEWGYDYFVSIDIDEYLVPVPPHVTIVDTLHAWFENSQRTVYPIKKNNFQSAPHILEPVNLLTIEAYQSRMPVPSKLNYYIGTAPKHAYKLSGPSLSPLSSQFIAECCRFHGCERTDLRANSTLCADHYETEVPQPKMKKLKHAATLLINHYSRSLEKNGLKAKTWKLAGRSYVLENNITSVAPAYDLPRFFARSVGWHYDPIALRYSCQLREQLRNMTGESPYLRPGDIWYRNPEYGKPVADPDKRGRYGRPNPEGFKYSVKNPYNYHGIKLGE